VLDRLAKKNAEKVRIIKVDATKNQKWAQKENVRAVPSFRLYRGGMEVDRFDGAYPQKEMQSKIDKYAMVLSTPSSTAKKEGEDGAASKQPAIQPMPKNWMPKGVTSE